MNLEDNSEILQFEATTIKVLNKFSLAPGEEPTGLAFDPKAASSSAPAITRPS